jgi:hypothetical protein
MLILPPHHSGGRNGEGEGARLELLLSPLRCKDMGNYQQTLNRLWSLELELEQLSQSEVLQ